MGAYFRLNEIEKSKILFDLREYFDKSEVVIFSYIYGEFFHSAFLKRIDLGIFIDENIINKKAKNKIRENILTDLEEIIDIPVDLVIINNLNLDHQVEIIKSTLLTCRNDQTKNNFIRKILEE